MTPDSTAPAREGWPERVASWGEALAMAMLLAMAALVVLQVVARDGFHLGLAWADELARYAGLTIVYLTSPLLLLRNRHVLVDILLNVLPARLRVAVECINDVLMVLFGALFLWGGWVFMQRAGRFSTPALGMPNLVFYAPVMLGMGLLFAAAVIRAVRQVAKLRRGDLATPPTDASIKL
jgi:TRAP-type C4-dicarboxylate transport system permease small subunit